MGKGKKNNSFDAIRALAVNKIAKDRNVTAVYVRSCINDTYKNLNAIEIKKDFNKLYSDLEKTLS